VPGEAAQGGRGFAFMRRPAPRANGVTMTVAGARCRDEGAYR
jgi:hypothetical protein